MWIGAGASTVQDLVLPRMRAVASAFYLLVLTFVGLALGPYTVGQLSDLPSGDLALAMRIALLDERRRGGAARGGHAVPGEATRPRCSGSRPPRPE